MLRIIKAPEEAPLSYSNADQEGGKVLIIEIDTTKKAGLIELGVQGEDAAEGVDFDVTSWIDEYGSGTAFIYIKRRTDEAPYFRPLPVTERSGAKYAEWIFDDADTAVQGEGECQLVYTVGAVVVKKTPVYATKTEKSLGEASGDIPDPYADLLEVARSILHATIEQANAASASASNADQSKTGAAASAASAESSASAAAASAQQAANTFQIAGDTSFSMDPTTHKVTMHMTY